MPFVVILEAGLVGGMYAPRLLLQFPQKRLIVTWQTVFNWPSFFS